MARGVSEDDLQGKNAAYKGPDDFAELVVAADRVVTI